MSNMLSMFEPGALLTGNRRQALLAKDLLWLQGPSSILHILHNIINNFFNVVLISLMHKIMNGSHL